MNAMRLAVPPFAKKVDKEHTLLVLHDIIKRDNSTRYAYDCGLISSTDHDKRRLLNMASVLLQSIDLT